MPKNRWAIIIALAAAWLGYVPAAKSEPIPSEEVMAALVWKTYHCTLQRFGVCVVKKNQGGRVAEFTLAAGYLYVSHMTLKIDGQCDSACLDGVDKLSYGAKLDYAQGKRDRAPEQIVCVTPNASFSAHRGWHQGFDGSIEYEDESTVRYIDGDLNLWRNNRRIPNATRREKGLILSFKKIEQKNIFPICGRTFVPNTP